MTSPEMKAWREEFDKLTEEAKDFLIKHIAKQEKLIERFPGCDCGEDHSDLYEHHLADQGLIMDFVMMAAYIAYNDDGEEITGYSVVQDDSRPHYTKIGLVDKCTEYLH